MSEEKPKQAPKQEAPKQEAPKEQSKEAAPKPVAPAAPAAEKKLKKINKMTLQELDKKLQDIKEKMGNFSSKYAMELLRRKKELSEQ